MIRDAFARMLPAVMITTLILACNSSPDSGLPSSQGDGGGRDGPVRMTQYGRVEGIS